MPLFQAMIQVLDRRHKYTFHRWIEAGDTAHATEIARKLVQIYNGDKKDYRDYTVLTVESKTEVLERVRERESGYDEETVESDLQRQGEHYE